MLARIWTWVERDVAPEDVAAYGRELLERSYDPETPDGDEEMAGYFRDAVLRRITQALATANAAPEKRRRLAGILGGDPVLVDLEDMISIMEHEASLKAILKTLPDQIDTGEQDHVSICGHVLSRARAVDHKLAAYAAVLIVQRIGSVSRVPRFALGCAGSSVFQVVLGSPAGALFELAVFELERIGKAIATALDAPAASRGAVDVPELLREYNLLSRNLRAALDFDNEKSDLSRRITEARAALSQRLIRELTQLPQLLRRAARPLKAAGKSPAMPDAVDADNAVMMVGLFDVCRMAVGELAVNEQVQRLKGEVETYIDNAAEFLVQDVRTSSGERKDIAMAHGRVALRLIETLHGASRAGVVRKSFDVASGGVFQKQAAFVA